MSISSAIDLASSGLRATQSGINVVSQNIANSNSVGYTRRTLTVSQQVTGNATSGVVTNGVSRALDTIVQKQLRLETAGAAYTGVKADYATSPDGLLDATSGTGTLPSLMSSLTASVTSLANNPASYTNRTGVLSAASTISSTLNSLSSSVQTLRQNAEDGIARDVAQSNTLVSKIAQLNGQMASDPASASSAALQDQRDGLIDDLSQYMDLKVTPQANGSVSLSTTGGLLLVDGGNATKLSFDAHSALSADATYSADSSKRTVGTITATTPAGATVDVLASGMIRSGEIAGFVEQRDETLTQTQTQLDSLAAGLASALSNTPVSGTAASNGAASGYDLDLSSLQNGNPITLSYTVGGVAKTLTLVKSQSGAAAAAATASGPNVVGVDFSGGLASAVSQIGTALGSAFSVSNPSGSTLRILDDGAANTTDVTGLSATATASSLANGATQLPLFVDSKTGLSYAGYDADGSQLTGFASRIGVNPAVTANVGALVTYSSSTASGDSTRPAFLLDALTNANQIFPSAAGIGGSTGSFNGTVSDFATQIVATQASNTTAATNLNDSQKVALSAIQSRFSDASGVNIDNEMTQLIQLQTAYAANARVMTAAKQMLDTLMSVGT